MSIYFESAEGVRVGVERILAEFREHGVRDEHLAEMLAEFQLERGEHEDYAAQDVLLFLGY